MESTTGTAYLTRLVTLIPSEVVALYLTFKEVASEFVGIWALICLGLVFVVRCAGARDKNGRVQIYGVGIACLSFVLWVYATGGSFPNLPPPSTKGVVSVAIGVWTFLIPYLYRGEERPKVP